jgi:alcohol dehydrogenase class IV
MSDIFNARYDYHFPTAVRFGKGVIEELPDHLKTEGIQRPLVVSDPGMVTLPFFSKIIEQLKQQNLDPHVFSSIHKNPVKSNVMDGHEAYRSHRADAVIGIGGGASMDVARAIVLKVNHPRDLFDYDDAKGGDQFVTEAVPYFVTVPTTSGTGSEVGRSTVIADDITKEKKILFAPKLLARKVFADPELTMGLPAFITATTGMDALTHNIEAYLSKGFSPLCDGIALEGVRLIAQSIEKATQAPDLAARSRMMMASLMGATAFQKGLGIVHSLAHPLSTVLDMHHGLANAIMLPFGMEFNAEACKDKMKILCEVAGLSDRSPEALVHWLKELNKKLGLPQDLRAEKIDAATLERLSRLAYADACHQSNPRAVTQEDFRKLYQKAMG